MPPRVPLLQTGTTCSILLLVLLPTQHCSLRKSITIFLHITTYITTHIPPYTTLFHAQAKDHIIHITTHIPAHITTHIPPHITLFRAQVPDVYKSKEDGVVFNIGNGQRIKLLKKTIKKAAPPAAAPVAAPVAQEWVMSHIWMIHVTHMSYIMNAPRALLSP